MKPFPPEQDGKVRLYTSTGYSQLIDPTVAIDVLATFIQKRFKEELTIAFIE